VNKLKFLLPILFVCILQPALASAQSKVAVLELRNEANITSQETAYLTDKVRNAASRTLGPSGFIVMTKENIRDLLPPGTDLAKCTTASCEVEVGRKIGADYIVTGEILKFSDGFRANLKAHHSGTGAFLGAEVCKGKSLESIEGGMMEAAKSLFITVRKHAGSGPPMPGIIGGKIGETPTGAWSPEGEDAAVVRFESVPAGAFVTADGNTVCPQTPCSEEIQVGPVTIAMHKKRYISKLEIVDISKDMKPITWKLDPNFALLNVLSEPPALSVTVKDKNKDKENEVGKTPLKNHMLDPGIYSVLVTDPRYFDTGEEFSINAGETKDIKVILTPRLGGLKISTRDQEGNAVQADVYIDGKKVGVTPGTFKVIIGEHHIEVRSPSGDWSERVEVKEKETLAIDATVARKIYERRDETDSRRTAAWVCTGVAVAGVGAGIAYYSRADYYNKKYEDEEDEDIAANYQQTGQSNQAMSIASFTVAGISAISAKILFQKSRKTDKNAWHKNMDFIYSRSGEVNRAAVLLRW
jgi:TolB-like protein